MKFVILGLLLFVSFQASAVDPIRIEIGKNYSSYSNEELRQRVWQLERAVAQLQEQVFQIAMDNRHNNKGGDWTCQMQSFGKTFVSNGNTRASAVAQVLKKCSDATNAVHCRESDASCDNE